jgi:hypothetical protein
MDYEWYELSRPVCPLQLGLAAEALYRNERKGDRKVRKGKQFCKVHGQGMDL